MTSSLWFCLKTWDMDTELWMQLRHSVLTHYSGCYLVAPSSSLISFWHWWNLFNNNWVSVIKFNTHFNQLASWFFKTFCKRKSLAFFGFFFVSNINIKILQHSVNWRRTFFHNVTMETISLVNAHKDLLGKMRKPKAV